MKTATQNMKQGRGNKSTERRKRKSSAQNSKQKIKAQNPNDNYISHQRESNQTEQLLGSRSLIQTTSDREYDNSRQTNDLMNSQINSAYNRIMTMSQTSKIKKLVGSEQLDVSFIE